VSAAYSVLSFNSIAFQLDTMLCSCILGRIFPEHAKYELANLMPDDLLMNLSPYFMELQVPSGLHK
jgi:hypothetical protein